MNQTVTLNNRVRMPVIGFGTYQMSPRITERCVRNALEIGYRLIDTAQCYGNEIEVGNAVLRSGILREDIFITTKLWGTGGYKDTVNSIRKSLDRLGTYIDLLLIHEPSSDYREIYRAMEDTLPSGNIRSIGVANFLGDTFRELAENCRIVPAVNQIETHVFRQQTEMQKLLLQYGTVLQSWSPLACARNKIFQNPVLIRIASNHGKTVAQVCLRWLLQRGIPVIPKTIHNERMAENFAITDFELTTDEMAEINQLDKGKSLFGWW